MKDKEQQQKKRVYLFLPAGFGCEAVAQLRGDLRPVFARYVDIQLFQNHTEEPSFQFRSPLYHFEDFKSFWGLKCQVVKSHKSLKLEAGRGKSLGETRWDKGEIVVLREVGDISEFNHKV